MTRKISSAILILFGFLSLAAIAVSQPAGHEKPIYERWEGGAVERWHRPEIKGKRSWFQSLIEETSNALWPSKSPPFGRSAALLTGVSDYKYLSPDLPSVEKDLKDMREFLLGDGGFDEVFVIKNENLDRDIIERYVKSKLPKRVGKNGRLLVYFSGHGGKNKKGATGYMQFRQARGGNFYGRNVLAINDVKDWSKEAEVKHLLVMLDCDISGLAFTQKGSQDCDTGILNTLSGKGSRIVITAGSGEQNAYAMDLRGKIGNGVFTRAFLDAFKDKSGTGGDCPLFIMDDIFGIIKRHVSYFSMDSGREMTPRKWNLDDNDLNGNFVFVRPGGKNLVFTDEQIKKGGLTKKSGAAPVVTETGPKYGAIEVVAQYDGRVYIDGVDSGEQVLAGVSKLFFPWKVGTHFVKVAGRSRTETKQTTVFHNSIVRVIFMKRAMSAVAAAPMAITRPEAPMQNSTAASQTAPASSITNSIGMKFVYIEPGLFDMGSPLDEPERYDNETQHKVTLTQGYYMQATEVTQKQWRSVMGNNPSYFKECGDKCPVENVSWSDVQYFIKKLSQKEGVSTYRLPTEAEWEYAARAGTTTPFSFGDGKCLSTDQANYNGNYPMPGCPKGEYRKKTVPVASFQPNGWGLYDMHGNVWEWCQDQYGAYPEGSITNPAGSKTGSVRVLRGGSWFLLARSCRSANRGKRDPGNRGPLVGARLVRLLP